MKELIGTRLRALRNGLNLTQAQVAERLGIQQSAITRYESGHSVPPPDVLVAIADFYDVSLDYIFGRADAPQGRQYAFQPESLSEQIEDNQKIRDFIEMCFDPASPANAHLKEILIDLMIKEGKP